MLMIPLALSWILGTEMLGNAVPMQLSYYFHFVFDKVNFSGRPNLEQHWRPSTKFL